MAEARKITKSALDALKPADKDVIYWDTELKGFGVKVTSRGRKVFLVMYRPKGQPVAKKYTIGNCSEWTVQQARERAQEILVEGSKGIDVHAVERMEAERMQSGNVSELVSQFLENHVSANRTAKETKRIFELDILPKIGKRSIHSITKQDVLTITESVAGRGSPIMANRTLAAFRKFLNWCSSRGIIDVSPAQGVKSVSREKARERHLNACETRSVFRASDKLGYPFGPIVKLLFLTAQRESEVAGMRWGEIDLEKAIWTIPSERAKNGKSNDVHLSKSAIAILQAIPHHVAPDGSDCEFVFTTTGKTRVSGFSKAKKKLDELSGVTGWRLHDIRRTAATGWSKHGVPIHVTEAILNHKSGTMSGVVAVYQRHDFIDDRQEALDWWSDHIEQLMQNDAIPVMGG